MLHPTRLVVYNMQLVGGRSVGRVGSANSTSQGLQAKLTPAYQHLFKRKAYCAVLGESLLKSQKCLLNKMVIESRNKLNKIDPVLLYFLFKE